MYVIEIGYCYCLGPVDFPLNWFDMNLNSSLIYYQKTIIAISTYFRFIVDKQIKNVYTISRLNNNTN